MSEKIYKLGIDVGSTTVKCMVMDGDVPIFDYYERHFSNITESVSKLLLSAYEKLGDVLVQTKITGSAGMSVGQWLNISFVQEVIAGSHAVKRLIPQTDVAIELGGEDAKITYFSGSMEHRMNGVCAGGTGSFIDQMAALLQTDALGLNALAEKSSNIYDIAARCGVFAKSDIQPLINEGAASEDIAVSVMQAVVNQTVSGLACGRPIRGKIAFLGGPLHFLPSLKERFIVTLKIKPEDVVKAPYSMTFVAAGAAIMADDEPITLKSILDKSNTEKSFVDHGNALKPLFETEEDRAAFDKRHSGASIEHRDIATHSGPVYLGIDAGSTTTKAVLTTADGAILYDYYGSNNGKPLDVMSKIITEVYDKLPSDTYIAYAVSTGYGENLAKTAYNIDMGQVETVAHYRAAKHFMPEVDFILDIGGQDMKCMYIKDGAIDEVILNEACSSGCGSFLETFATSLDVDIMDFAGMALAAKHPVDLGNRCTVFMNSKVKQVQKEGASLNDILAGLSYSVVKNALFKVIKLKNPDDLGKNIVVQGGTFLNEAVLRSFELLTSREVVRPQIAGLMGAYGAALIAVDNELKGEISSIITLDELNDLTVKKSNGVCKQCENRCKLTINTFSSGRRFISGNRCEKGAGLKVQHSELTDMYDYTYKRLFGYKSLEPNEAIRGDIGIPRVLGIYENYPFWHEFFTRLSYRVILSPRSSKAVYSQGMESIPSESLCYPAKMAHGAVKMLINQGVKRIFFPCVPYEKKEHGKANNNYNCPIVTSYSENIKNNMTEIKENDIDFLMPFLPMDNIEALQKRLIEEMPYIPAEEILDASNAAWEEKANFQNDIQSRGAQVVEKVKKGEIKAIILGGRPYHVDPEINHGISSIITSMGFAVLTEQSVSHLGEYNPIRVLDQWMYHTRIYTSAHLAGRIDGLELVQLNSFGCGLDAVVTDQAQEILYGYGKLYTLLKIDEINNTGAVKIRLRSLKAAIDEREKKNPLRNIVDTAKNTVVKYKKVVFEKFMKKEYTILSPQMSPIHFELVKTAFKSSGYNFELLDVVDKSAIDEGLRYVNNDACYPSILVTGQLIDAIKSGKYDTDRVACIISQTGGGCRASNYIGFIRKALKDAGYAHIPVISLSATGMEKHPGFKFTPKMIRRAVRCLVYGDLLNRLQLRTEPYEKNVGDTKRMYDKWVELARKSVVHLNVFKYRWTVRQMIREFDNVPIRNIKKPIIGVVGEILVKYHPTANNQLVKVLQAEGAEVKVPDIIDFLLYCAYNSNFKSEKLGKSKLAAMISNAVIYIIERNRGYMRRQLDKSKRFTSPSFINKKAEASDPFLSQGNQTGEGWFLTGEMAELLEEGVDGIVCAQPFACLPNHIVGKGVIQAIRTKYPKANITAIDYDPGASEVNQLNRIKLMISIAKENIENELKLSAD